MSGFIFEWIRENAEWFLSLDIILEIPDHDQHRFTRGEEARMIREWLGNRSRLHELPGALAQVDRADLAGLLRHG